MVKPAELMAYTLSKHLNDGEVAIMGAFSGIPMLASRLAQLTHAPNLSYITGGSGAVNPLLEPLVASSCDDRLLKAECVVPLSDVIDFEARTEIDIFFAGGLQIDERGNCNLTGDGLYEEDGPQLNMGYGDIIDEVTVVSEYVVRFDLHIAFSPFLQLMSCAASYMVHPM